MDVNPSLRGILVLIKPNGRAKLAPMHETKEKILQQALQFVSLYGIEALSIGQLAKDTKMSKSGLFAHFQSKEKLQIDVLLYGAQRYEDLVFRPAIAQPRGVARIRALVAGWAGWIGQSVAGDCPVLASLTELDEKEGPVRDCVFGLMNRYLENLEKMAQITVDVGQFRSGSDAKQIAFELISLLLGYQTTRKLSWTPEGSLQKSVESLIARYST